MIKNADLLPKQWQINVVLVVKDIFSETISVYVLTKFQASSIILTSFRQGVLLPLPPPPPTKQAPKNPIQIRIKNLDLRKLGNVSKISKYQRIIA